MDKVVLFIRVSSSKQETASQRIELERFVKSHGYTDEQMIKIDCTVSATKDEYSSVMNELINLIETQEIKCLYSTEFSRLARIPALLEDLKHVLIDNQTNLITKQENFTLFDENGNVTMMAKIMFDLWKNITEDEIQRKNERVARGIALAADRGQWLGGKDVLFGYKVDENKHYQLHETKTEMIDDVEKTIIGESQIVKEVFDLYATGSHSFATIEKEIFDLHAYQLDRKNLGRILNNPYYTGEKILKEGYVYARQYPVIISKETFEQCQTLLKQRSNRKQDKSKNVYYAGKILSCNCCQSRLTAFGNRNNYACKNFHEKKGCTNGTSINLNVVDSLALKVAWDKDYSEQKHINADTIIKVENSIKLLQTKIDVAGSKLDTIRQSKQKQFKKILTHLSDSDIQKQVELSLKIDKQQIDVETIGYKNEIERLNKFLESKKSYITIDDGTKYQFTYKYPQVFIKDMSDKQRYDMVHQYIKNIAIRDISPTTKEISITTFCNETSVFQYNNKKKDKKQRLIEIIDDKSNPINWDKFIIERTF